MVVWAGCPSYRVRRAIRASSAGAKATNSQTWLPPGFSTFHRAAPVATSATVSTLFSEYPTAFPSEVTASCCRLPKVQSRSATTVRSRPAATSHTSTRALFMS